MKNGVTSQCETQTLRLGDAIGRSDKLRAEVVTEDGVVIAYADFEPEVVAGDVNWDMRVDMNDVAALALFVRGEGTFRGGMMTQPPPLGSDDTLGCDLPFSDVNQNSIVDAEDIALLSRRVADSSFPLPRVLTGIELPDPNGSPEEVIDGLLEALRAPANPLLAEVAYRRLFYLGDVAVGPVIQALEGVSANEWFGGRIPQNTLSSHPAVAVRLWQAHVLLIESIRRGRLNLFRNPRVVGKKDRVTGALVEWHQRY